MLTEKMWFFVCNNTDFFLLNFSDVFRNQGLYKKYARLKGVYPEYKKKNPSAELIVHTKIRTCYIPQASD